jgi:hypothetical protein
MVRGVPAAGSLRRRGSESAASASSCGMRVLSRSSLRVEGGSRRASPAGTHSSAGLSQDFQQFQKSSPSPARSCGRGASNAMDECNDSIIDVGTSRSELSSLYEFSSRAGPSIPGVSRNDKNNAPRSASATIVSTERAATSHDYAGDRGQPLETRRLVRSR